MTKPCNCSPAMLAPGNRALSRPNFAQYQDATADLNIAFDLAQEAGDSALVRY